MLLGFRVASSAKLEGIHMSVQSSAMTYSGGVRLTGENSLRRETKETIPLIGDH
jgi:hypothetical protein